MHCQLVLVIVTDGSPELRVEKNTVDQAIGVCRRAGTQVNVIGQSSMGLALIAVVWAPAPTCLLLSFRNEPREFQAVYSSLCPDLRVDTKKSIARI